MSEASCHISTDESSRTESSSDISQHEKVRQWDRKSHHDGDSTYLTHGLAHNELARWETAVESYLSSDPRLPPAVSKAIRALGYALIQESPYMPHFHRSQDIAIQVLELIKETQAEKLGKKKGAFSHDSPKRVSRNCYTVTRFETPDGKCSLELRFALEERAKLKTLDKTDESTCAEFGIECEVNLKTFDSGSNPHWSKRDIFNKSFLYPGYMREIQAYLEPSVQSSNVSGGVRVHRIIGTEFWATRELDWSLYSTNFQLKLSENAFGRLNLSLMLGMTKQVEEECQYIKAYLMSEPHLPSAAHYAICSIAMILVKNIPQNPCFDNLGSKVSTALEIVKETRATMFGKVWSASHPQFTAGRDPRMLCSVTHFTDKEGEFQLNIELEICRKADLLNLDAAGLNEAESTAKFGIQCKLKFDPEIYIISFPYPEFQPWQPLKNAKQENVCCLTEDFHCNIGSGYICGQRKVTLEYSSDLLQQ